MKECPPGLLDPLSEAYCQFTRVVCSGTGDDQFPLQRLGTGTVVAYEGDFYLITARHLFDNTLADPTSVVVSPSKAGGKWWPTDACLHLEAHERYKNDDTFGDLAIYSIAMDRSLKSSVSKHEFLPFPEPTHFEPGHQLFGFGFPDLGIELNLDDRFYDCTQYGVEGIYKAKTRYEGIHRFESEHLPDSVNGMSGGPITYLNISSLGRHLLAGLTISGGNGMLHFVDASKLREAFIFALPDLKRLRSGF